jgi:hypothetical protein
MAAGMCDVGVGKVQGPHNRVATGDECRDLALGSLQSRLLEVTFRDGQRRFEALSLPNRMSEVVVRRAGRELVEPVLKESPHAPHARRGPRIPLATSGRWPERAVVPRSLRTEPNHGSAGRLPPAPR